MPSIYDDDDDDQDDDADHEFVFEKLRGLTDAQNVSGLKFAFLPIEGAQVGAWMK